VDEDRRSGEDGGSDALSGRKKDAQAPDVSQPEPLPATLRQRLDRCADKWLYEHESAHPAAAEAAAVGSAVTAARASRTALPWILAAACLGLAVGGWWPRAVDIEPGAASAGPVGQWRARLARERMLSSPHRVGHWPWASGAEGSGGDVVWDNARQRGFLRLRRFVVNDPTRARYQLWIFDAARDDRYPVDGGVFDVPPGREDVVIPVRASLPVLRPVAFAVTVEGSRGAVVSEREKVVAFARAGG